LYFYTNTLLNNSYLVIATKKMGQTISAGMAEEG